LKSSIFTLYLYIEKTKGSCSLRSQFLVLQEAGAIGVIMARPLSDRDAGEGGLTYVLQAEKTSVKKKMKFRLFFFESGFQITEKLYQFITITLIFLFQQLK
jgi:hypothetical protein